MFLFPLRADHFDKSVTNNPNESVNTKRSIRSSNAVLNACTGLEERLSHEVCVIMKVGQSFFHPKERTLFFIEHMSLVWFLEF